MYRRTSGDILKTIASMSLLELIKKKSTQHLLRANVRTLKVNWIFRDLHAMKAISAISAATSRWHDQVRI